jgi:hypothetical protein
MRFGTEEADPVLWMRLVSLGVKFGESYLVVPSVVDPDFVIGGAGSTGTVLPGWPKARRRWLWPASLVCRSRALGRGGGSFWHSADLGWRVHFTRRQLPMPCTRRPTLQRLPIDALAGWLDSQAPRTACRS